MIDLNGVWYNELKSKMTLKVQGNLVTGVYESRVGDAKGVYSLTGFFDSELQSSNCIGWVVVWKNETENSDAVTTWSGQVQKDENKEDTIITTWLLTCETDVNDDWHSTMIGKDKFTRREPTVEEVSKKIKIGVKSSSPIK